MDAKLTVGDRRATLEQLRAFLLIADEAGFSAAGALLGRSQSALTQSLRKLEETVGCRLIDRRQGHVLGLTVAGRRLLPQAREILARVDLAVDTLRRPALAGRVRLGVPDDMRAGDVQAALAGTLALNADLAVEVRSALSGEIAELHARGELDVALFRQPAGSPAAGAGHARVLRREQLVWVAGEATDFARRGPLPLVLFSPGCPYRQAILAILAAHGRESRIVYSTHTRENLRGAVRAGLGLTAVPADALFEGAVVLDERRGFPPLPAIALVLAMRDGEGSHRLLAADLVMACRLDGDRSTA